MRIGIVSPAPKGSTLGNSVTADRYARIFRSLGHRVAIRRRYGGERFDCLVSLHASKSGRSALAFRKHFPARLLIVVLTGTDLYRDLASSRIARRALEAATAIVVLQPEGLRAMPAAVRVKATAIMQSATPASPRSGTKAKKRPTAERPRRLEVCVLGHLRAEKDPLRAARAVVLLSRSLAIRVTQAGRALDFRYASAAQRLARKSDGRYRWLGELSRAAARELLARSDLMVLSSRMEGGANVLCEAIASGVAVLASKIAGNIGIVGRDYRGLFEVGDTKALAALMQRAAVDDRFLASLRRRCVSLQPLVNPARERAAWAKLVGSA